MIFYYFISILHKHHKTANVNKFQQLILNIFKSLQKIPPSWGLISKKNSREVRTGLYVLWEIFEYNWFYWSNLSYFYCIRIWPLFQDGPFSVWNWTLCIGGGLCLLFFFLGGWRGVLQVYLGRPTDNPNKIETLMSLHSVVLWIRHVNICWLLLNVIIINMGFFRTSV